MKYIIMIKQSKTGWDSFSNLVDGEESIKTKRECGQLKRAFEEAVKKINQWQESSERQPATLPQKQVASGTKS